MTIRLICEDDDQPFGPQLPNSADSCSETDLAEIEEYRVDFADKYLFAAEDAANPEYGVSANCSNAKAIFDKHLDELTENLNNCCMGATEETTPSEIACMNESLASTESAFLDEIGAQCELNPEVRFACVQYDLEFDQLRRSYESIINTYVPPQDGGDVQSCLNEKDALSAEVADAYDEGNAEISQITQNPESGLNLCYLYGINVMDEVKALIDDLLNLDCYPA